MNILIVGNGGREAALAWKLAQSNLATKIIITPSHPAAELMNPKIISSPLTAEALAVEYQLALAVIGPEVPLSEGLADRLRALGVATVGPSQAAAQLECSKDFAKQVMKSANVPTSMSESFTSPSDAKAYVSAHPTHLVVKVDGPAQGKGVVVCDSIMEAHKAIDDFFSGATLGAAVEKLVIEEKMSGRELSAFALCAGEEFVWLGVARDHKRLRNCDQGPNTGGMGTVSPLKDFSSDERAAIEARIFRPVLNEMAKRGTPFQGFLFAGLMRTNEGLKVLEFNVRLGDPETQVLLPLFQGDLLPLLLDCAHNQLPKELLQATSQQCAVHVVVAAPGYPGTEGVALKLGDAIDWRPFPAEDVMIFPAGITGTSSNWKSRGGRIMGVTALGKDIEEARMKAYREVKRFAFSGCQWREDIGVTL